MKFLIAPWLGEPCMKKKLASSCLPSALDLQIICAIANFPEPAGPCSQNKPGPVGLVIQCWRHAMILSLVPG